MYTLMRLNFTEEIVTDLVREKASVSVGQPVAWRPSSKSHMIKCMF